MGTTVRVLVGAILVAVTYGGIYVLGGAGTPTVARLPEQDLRELPARLGSWTVDETLPDAELIPTDAEITVSRVYRNPAGEMASLLASVWVDYGHELPHRPEGCYQCSGHHILMEKNVRVDIADQSSIPFRLLLLERRGERKCVLYWYQLGDEILVRNNWRRRTTWTVWRRNPPRPLVKVMIEVPATDPEKAENQLRSIAAPLIAWTRKLR